MARIRIGPLALLVPLCLAAYAVQRYLDDPPSSSLGRFGDADRKAGPEVSRSALVGSGRAGEDASWTACLVRMGPGEDSSGERGSLYETGLARRLGLSSARAFRLRLEIDQGSARLGDLLVRDADGVALLPLAERMAGTAGDAPLAALFGHVPEAVTPSAPARLVLWGREPGADAVLEVGGPAGGSAILPLSPTDLDEASACASETWLLALAAPELPAPSERPADESRTESDLEADVSRLRNQVAMLEHELALSTAVRQQRELAWFDYNRALGALGLDDKVGLFPTPDLEEHTAAEPAQAEPEPDPARVRAHEIRLALSTLLKRERVYGLDLIELGRVQEGAVGPVVFRLLDDEGRLAGGLFAARLRLEGSRAAQLLTLVLEDGHESHAGQNVPFVGGERRISLPFVDPKDWFERMPELFGADGVRALTDDGLWDLDRVRGSLNRLLRVDVQAGWYRLKSFGGVNEGELLEVHLEVFHVDGRLLRRIFADRLRVRPEDPGVRLELFDGATVRGDEKTAFRQGRLLLFLPGADLDAWRAADIPGLDDDG